MEEIETKWKLGAAKSPSKEVTVDCSTNKPKVVKDTTPSPRREQYEAKFQKYLINRSTKKTEKPTPHHSKPQRLEKVQFDVHAKVYDDATA